MLQGILHFLGLTLYFVISPLTQKLTHKPGPLPPSSPSLQVTAAKAAAWQWRQQRRHGNVTAMPVTAQWRQRDSMAVAEGIARRQRWQDITAVAVAWLRC
jgi:hypothetical protein